MRSTCEVPDCVEFVVGQGLCRRHYMRLFRKGSIDDTRKNARQQCSEPDCNDLTVALGLCAKHYKRSSPQAQARAAELKAERIARRTGRICQFCSEPIPIERNTRAIYCSLICKTNAGNVHTELTAYKARTSLLKKKYQLSREQFDELLARQGGVCAICGTDKPGNRGAWCVDHDHSCCRTTTTCGKCIRGILCNNCNGGIGKLGDCPERLVQAAEYLMGIKPRRSVLDKVATVVDK